MRRKEPLKRCPVCNCLTSSAEKKSYDICPVCYWEDDGSENEMPTSECAGGPNGSSVDEARRNYQKFGACRKKFLPFVRKPKTWEK
ncbi:MAG: hypothetical protein K5846_09565 [Bacteroidales bacterium]|nr:hypothetical protein [Bacteroidales bacterium]